MKVYLVQHGRPVPKEEDPQRPLSAQGRADVERVALFLEKAGVKVEEIIHSGKLRAMQTAEILSSRIGSGTAISEWKGISPLDDVKPVAAQIQEGKCDRMLVGHLPHMAKLASLLTAGDETSDVIAFQQGAVVCLREVEGQGWAVAWMVVPELLPA